jgi:CubicO group peptidase (beta-lactamase class C family)
VPALLLTTLLLSGRDGVRGSDDRQERDGSAARKLSHEETLRWIAEHRAWRPARKTKPIWARPVAPEEVGKEVETADHAKEVVREDAWLCVGVAGEPWLQTRDKLEGKYEPSGETTKRFEFDKEPRQYRIYGPKAAARNWVAQVKGPGIEGFSIRPGYDPGRALYSPAGGYVVRDDVPDPYEAPPEDVWLVQQPLFESTYELLSDTGSRGSPPALACISERMRRFVDDRETAGAVTLVATPDRIVHLDATGKADIASDRTMRPDTIFWIASMTKPITATAVLMLQDEGKLSVEDPVEKYIPEFSRLMTADGEPARVTIRHLLTHTSGMGEISPDEARNIKDLTGVIPLYVARPVRFEQGTKWVYCQSGINTAARIVEVVSGSPFDVFVDRRLFRPLGMKDTTFYLTEEQLPRLATSYRRTKKGELEPAELRILYGKGPTSRDRFPAANGGLFSTAPDYARFCRMILNGGELEGRRYVKPESVKLMTSVQTGTLKTGFTDGNGWGLGWCVVREPQGATAMLSPGTFGHGGAYGTQAWIDPAKKRIDILMIQRSDFPNSDASAVRRAFQEAAASATDGQ